jgi:hypothetical protein
MEKACAACPKIYEFDEAIPKFGTLPTTEPKEVACADWVSQQVIFASELPKETWFNIIRLFLGLICVAMSIVSIFQADSPYKFGTSILLGHATEFTKKKDKGNNGDGGYWFGVAFCIMLFCGAGFYAGPIPMQYHLDQTIVWGMATGLVVSGGGMGWMVKLQKKSAGNVEVTPDDATTHKMLFSDYVIAITFLMGILGPLFGYATKGPNSAEWIGTNMTAAFAGFITPFMLAAVAGTITQQGALRDSKVAKIMSVVGMVSLVISFILMGVAGDTFYVFVNADEVAAGDRKFTNAAGGYCTAKHSFAAAKAVDAKYTQAMYCSVFKKDLNALVFTPEDSTACTRAVAQYKSVHGNSTDCRCSNMLDLDPWPEAVTFASWINVTQISNLVAAVAIALEIITTLVSSFIAKGKGGGGSNAKVVPEA